ncbi:tellurite resistance protein TerC [Clostridium saccharoperbutylacetonicum]|uniref:Integral membrane protein, TerC family n=1 Tax=Clostridium saccharoperbutylacetonicum N1-4(HMT) TaxID=931276 RepID=M1MN71_9CLOT|nr:TerC/Alx family metal homeostasis membrane protein [Clostridium saccharoperbutylacetonicum]AGF57653.1 integral membrane protein, TerC family [Clostridium saccharoperbutylacetonicum N1-4(HMT)]NRT61579.1 tellurite resistance protein TerC [Clostridium saccharoperbutylacetonicum]NSB24902.1 tellurite resistance protein TerC [Clostridium saccharoperbutylacetonicum]NSB44273.1 tellurite resistance protein TerC [Clostridium saccharoperbutylacetonicum]
MSTRKHLFKFLLITLIAMIFNLAIWYYMGRDSALEFLGGYIIELSLSVDNLFLFLLIFSSFGISSKYQKRVLSYGIFGAIILRFIFVILGIAIINTFKWVLYVFGVLLIISGIKIMINKEEDVSFENSKLIKLLKKMVPVTKELHDEKFFVKINNVLHVTPLFALLFLIEGSDLLFAIDSIPAIFAITTNAFIVYTSNIFAILGLRNLYFILEKLHSTFEYVKYGVGLILIFTGIKLGISFKYHISVGISLAVIISILILSVLVSVLVSIIINKKKQK